MVKREKTFEGEMSGILIGMLLTVMMVAGLWHLASIADLLTWFFLIPTLFVFAATWAVTGLLVAVFRG